MLVIGPPSRPLSGEIASWETLGRSAARVARPTPGPQNAVQSDSLGELQAHFARPPHALWLASLSLCSSGCGCDPPCTGLSLPSTTYIKHTPIRANLFRMPEARSPSDTDDSRLLLFGNQFDPDPRQVGQQFLGNRTDGVTACNPASTSFGRTARRIPPTPEMADEGSGNRSPTRPPKNGLQIASLETRTATILVRLLCLGLAREDRRSLHWKTRATPLGHTLRTATSQGGSVGRTPQ